MASTIKINAALISVYDKTGLAPIIHQLASDGVVFYSTGGTQEFIESIGYSVIPVEDLTSYPSILGGRVKTLHPKVFGGILNRRDVPQDQAQLKEFEIPQLDLVIVDLYPFEATVKSGASHEDIVEKIDIGGISLIRAGAKMMLLLFQAKRIMQIFLKSLLYKIVPPALSNEFIFRKVHFTFLRIMMA
jgi:phosphoribosylaminoimidazolecarboxamide formyltransferase / IMP cyclohydrolase